jgi:hypothetical protein
VDRSEHRPEAPRNIYAKLDVSTRAGAVGRVFGGFSD